MSTIDITPGTMGTCGLACDLFGLDRVVPSGWCTPVTVKDLTDEEVEFAKEFFAEYDLTVTVRPQHQPALI